MAWRAKLAELFLSSQSSGCRVGRLRAAKGLPRLAAPAAQSRGSPGRLRAGRGENWLSSALWSKAINRPPGKPVASWIAWPMLAKGTAMIQ